MYGVAVGGDGVAAGGRRTVGEGFADGNGLAVGDGFAAGDGFTDGDGLVDGGIGGFRVGRFVNVLVGVLDVSFAPHTKTRYPDISPLIPG